MNIIKLKDIIKPDDELFNSHLKGRYAYWIQMRYIVPFDLMGYEGYVACEMDINKLLKKEDGSYPIPFGCPYIDTYVECDIYPYIDATETDRINSMSDYIIKNNYVTDSDITVDELKKFRTWLATQLLLFDQNNLGQQLYVRYDADTTSMLEYYKNGMIDNTIESLIRMSVYKDSAYKVVTDNTCCCNRVDTEVELLYNINMVGCDPVTSYRSYIYNKMVSIYSEINFWTQFPSEFILEMKKYIDNIIRLDFTLYKQGECFSTAECGELTGNNNLQLKYKGFLKNLSESLQFIANGEIMGHKNFIGDSLYNWSTLLYENMEW